MHHHPGPPHRVLTLLALAPVLVLTACDARADGPTGDFFDRSPWHDGNAEVNFYEATELRYDTPREADEAVLIFVKEDHLAEGHVKADNPREADLPAVKLNWVVAIPTGIYTYRQQVSVFIDRRSNLPFRQTFASHEWCGNVYKDLRRANGRDGRRGFRYTWSSYFEEDGEGERSVDPDAAGGPVVFADALPAYVRTARADHTLAVLPSLRSIRAEADGFAAVSATLRIGEEHEVSVPAGQFAVRTVTIDYADGRAERFDVEAGRRGRLVQMHLADGAVYRLRRSLRIDYWNHNAPGDETLREGVGVD